MDLKVIHKCPTCDQTISTLPIKKAIKLLKKRRRNLRKKSLRGSEVKRIFGIKDEDLKNISCEMIFGEERYDKENIERYIKDKKYKMQCRLSL